MWSLLLYSLLIGSLHQSNGLVVRSTPFSPSARDQPNVVTLETISNLNLPGTLDPIAIRPYSGSSDLWIVPPKDFAFNNTRVPISDGYVGGDFNGTLGVATVELGGYSFGSQAFNNATVVSVSGFTDISVDGLIGLSFDGPGASPIMSTLSAIGQDSKLGKPFLFNIFNQAPGKSNFIGVSLPRTDDPNGSATGSFSINEVDPAYAAAANAPSLPLFPGNNSIWSMALDSMSVENVSVTLPPSNVPGAPAGKSSANTVDHPMQHDILSRFALWPTLRYAPPHGTFNFGNTSQTLTVNSSIQLLSQTDAAAAAKDAVQVRTALLANFSASAQGKTVSANGSGTRPSVPVVVGLLFAGFINVVQNF
ncbi:hypothetical protein K438DRAFT_1753647 [Mycena galopus ATCC 62051]|nr:hypothetical protein K438DRAFT_1753647 [Mycena galopus ATCC 62051]